MKKQKSEQGEHDCKCSKKNEIIQYSIIIVIVLGLLNLFFLFGVNDGVVSNQKQIEKISFANNAEGCDVEIPTTIGSDLDVEKTDSFSIKNIDDDAVEGNLNAPVTIIEFSDYECPFCERFYSGALPELREKYVETGKVKIIFRDFPLDFHENAQKAAEAAECAGEQGKYYEMHDKIFENQSNIGVANLKSYAGEIGLNQSEFDTCLDTGAMADEVQKDFSDGQVLGVSGTPTFFINGKKLVGAQPFSAFKQIIDAELAK